MDDKLWRDEELAELRGIHVATLSEWDRARPDPHEGRAELTPEQAEALRAAIEAEAAYDTRRRELGLL